MVGTSAFCQVPRAGPSLNDECMTRPRGAPQEPSIGSHTLHDGNLDTISENDTCGHWLSRGTTTQVSTCGLFAVLKFLC